MPEVRVAGKERDVVIDADLSDERVGQTRLQSTLQQLSPQQPATLPVALRQSEQWNAPEDLQRKRRDSWFAEDLGENRWGQNHLLFTEQNIE